MNVIGLSMFKLFPVFLASDLLTFDLLSQKKELANTSAHLSLIQEKCDNICIISSERARFHLFHNLFYKDSGFLCISGVVVEKIPSEE